MSPEQRVDWLRVEGGALYPALRIDLAPRLTCFIAPRGGGKTTAMHAIRWGLGAPPPLNEEQRARYDKQIEKTIGPGKVTVGVTAHGRAYESARKGEDPPVVSSDHGVVLPDVTLAGELFHAEFYGPHEIESMATDPTAQLALLDSFAEAEVRAVSVEIVHIERTLSQNAGDLARIDAELEEDARKTAELPQIEAALEGLQRADGPDADALLRAHAAKEQRGKERTAIDALAKDLAAVRGAFAEFARVASQRIARATDAELEKGAHPEVFRRANAAAHEAAGAIESHACEIARALSSAEEVAAHEGRALAALHVGEEDAYRALLAQQNEDAARADTRARLQARRDELARCKRREDDRRRERDLLQSKRDAMLAERARLYGARFAIRQRVVAELQAEVGDEIRLSILHCAGREAYRALLEEILHGTGTKSKLLDKIAEHVRPRDLVAAVRAGDLERITSVDPMKTDREDRAQRLFDALRAKGRLAEIETVPLADLPIIALRMADGEYKPATDVSTGESCTCILPLVLLQPRGPLFLDQPEDSLDGGYVYDVLVQSIRRVKMRRQVVIITHNPTLLVLSDPERVYLLGKQGAKSRVVKYGTVDELREEIERLMEGGREAFLLRAKRYGHKGE